MPTFNRVILVGNLTKDPELKYLAKKNAVCNARLAVNNRVKRDDTWVDDPTFVDVTLWGRTAEVANEFLRKGSLVLIEGRLKLDTWETNDGEKHSRLKVVAERMQMLSSKNGRPTDGDPVGEESAATAEEVPF
jgi:single-strand DNA-binding protein